MKNISNLNEIEKALGAIPFPIAYEEWLKIGFALANELGPSEAARLMYYYSPPTKGHERETVRDYERMFAQTDGRVTIATLFHIAKQYGYEPLKPKPKPKHTEPEPTSPEPETPGVMRETEFPYYDADGTLLYKKIRTETLKDGKKSKTFRFSPKLEANSKRVIYRLPEVLKAKERGETIFFVEGEKDVETLRKEGVTATTTDCGANASWIEKHTHVLEPLQGCKVVVICDNDNPGKDFALAVCNALHGKVASLKYVDLATVVQGFPEKADVTDWIELYHGTRDKLLSIVEGLSEFVPPRCEPESEPELYEPSSEERLAFSAPMQFSASLLYGATMHELFDYYKSVADVPNEFLFVSTLSTLCGIVGGRVAVTFGAIRITPHDYFVVLSQSGRGKSTALNPVSELINQIERKILKTSNEPNCIAFPQRATERGIIGLMREETQVERLERERKARKASKKKQNKSDLAPEIELEELEPERVPQTNGILVNDEITSLFDDLRKDYNAGFDSTVLRLWDGNPISFATSEKNDGRIQIGATALTILGASTSEKFRYKLPKTAFTDGLIARLQFCYAPEIERPRRLISDFVFSLVHEANPIQSKLLSLFQFVAITKTIRLDASVREADERTRDAFYEQSKEFTNEAIVAYYQRIDVRKFRYALLFAVLDAFERKQDAVTIRAEHIEHAAKVCDYFKSHTLHFIGKETVTGAGNGNGNGSMLSPVQETAGRIEKVLIEKFDGQTTKRKLFKSVGREKTLFERSLNMLSEIGKVIVTEITYRNQPGLLVTHYSKKISEPPSAPSASSAPKPQVIVNKELTENFRRRNLSSAPSASSAPCSASSAPEALEAVKVNETPSASSAPKPQVIVNKELTENFRRRNLSSAPSSAPSEKPENVRNLQNLGAENLGAENASLSNFSTPSTPSTSSTPEAPEAQKTPEVPEVPKARSLPKYEPLPEPFRDNVDMDAEPIIMPGLPPIIPSRGIPFERQKTKIELILSALPEGEIFESKVIFDAIKRHCATELEQEACAMLVLKKLVRFYNVTEDGHRDLLDLYMFKDPEKRPEAFKHAKEHKDGTLNLFPEFSTPLEPGPEHRAREGEEETENEPLFNGFASPLEQTIDKVLSELPSGEVFNGKVIRDALKRHCDTKYEQDKIGRILLASHLLRFYTITAETGKKEMLDLYMFREPEKRPKTFRNDKENADGTIELAPF